MIKSLILQIKFLTRIPVPFDVPFDDDAFARGVIYAPLVGLLIGLILAAVYFLFSLTGKPGIAVVMSILTGILITGGLHLDGLADTCDGIFSNRPREMMLEIMRDSRIGTNGTLALLVTVILKVVLVSSLDSGTVLKCLIVMPVLSRMAIAWSAGYSSYAREGGGLGRTMIDNAGTREIMLSTIISAPMAVFILKEKVIAGIIAVILLSMAVSGYAKNKLGGITGDVLGAVIELSEIAFLFAMVIYEAAV